MSLDTIEHWTLLESTPLYLFAAAKMKFSWPIGKEITLEVYKEAIEATKNHVAR